MTTKTIDTAALEASIMSLPNARAPSPPPAPAHKSQSNPHFFKNFIALDRVRGLSDAIFATIITLLVVELREHVQHRDSSISITYSLLGLWKQLLAFFAAVWIVSTLWLSHVYTFAAVQGSDSTLAYLNLLMLLFTSIVPFSISVIVEWPGKFYAIVLNNTVLFLISMSLLVMWLYIMYRRRFIHGKAHFPTQFLWIVTLRYAFSPIVYGIAIGVAVLNFWAAIAVTLVVPTLQTLAIMGLDVFKLIVVISSKCCSKARGKKQEQVSTGHKTEETSRTDTLAQNPPTIPPLEVHNIGNIQETNSKEATVSEPNYQQQGHTDLNVTHPPPTTSRTAVSSTEVSPRDSLTQQRPSTDHSQRPSIDLSQRPSIDMPRGSIDTFRRSIEKSRTSTEKTRRSNEKRRGSVDNSQNAKPQEVFIFGKSFHGRVLERIKIFADAVFAIVITVLILQFKVPSSHDEAHAKNEDLGKGLADLWPTYVSFTVSGCVVANFWKSHTLILRGIERTDRFFVYSNVIYLAFISLVPFASDIMAKFHFVIVSEAFFNLLLFIIGLIMFIMFLYVNLNSKMKHKDHRMSKIGIATASLRLFVGMFIFLIGFGVSFASTYAGIAMALIVPAIDVLAAFELDLFRFMIKFILKMHHRLCLRHDNEPNV